PAAPHKPRTQTGAFPGKVLAFTTRPSPVPHRFTSTPSPSCRRSARARLGSVFMTWLITGGAGYIGAHVARAMAGAGESVVVLDDLSTGAAARLGADVSPLEVC